MRRGEVRQRDDNDSKPVYLNTRGVPPTATEVFEEVKDSEFGCSLRECGEVLEGSIATIIQTSLAAKPDELVPNQLHDIHDKGEILTFGNKDIQFGQRSARESERNCAFNGPELR